MKSYEEIMEILEALALTNSYRAAGELVGCSHHAVEHYVALRDAGLLPVELGVVERVKLVGAVRIAITGCSRLGGSGRLWLVGSLPLWVHSS